MKPVKGGEAAKRAKYGYSSPISLRYCSAKSSLCLPGRSRSTSSNRSKARLNSSSLMTGNSPRVIESERPPAKRLVQAVESAPASVR